MSQPTRIRSGWRGSRSPIRSASAARKARIRCASSAAAIRGAVAVLHRRGPARRPGVDHGRRRPVGARGHRGRVRRLARRARRTSSAGHVRLRLHCPARCPRRGRDRRARSAGSPRPRRARRWRGSTPTARSRGHAASAAFTTRRSWSCRSAEMASFGQADPAARGVRRRVSPSTTEAAAALAAVERAAEALDAEVAAIVRRRRAPRGDGLPGRRRARRELEAVRPGAADCRLEVPGAGWCAAAAAAWRIRPARRWWSGGRIGWPDPRGNRSAGRDGPRRGDDDDGAQRPGR